MNSPESPDEIAWIKSLDRAAASAVPTVDVASSVMREIHHARQISPPENGLPLLAAALASLAGVSAATVGIIVWLGMQDPVIEFVEPLRLVLQ